MKKTNESEILFEIENSFHIAKAITYFVGGILLYLMVLSGDKANEIAKTIAVSAFGYGLFRIIGYKKERDELKIKFTKSEINIPFERINLKVDEIKEIYKVSSIYFDVLRKLRIGIIGRIVFKIIFPINFITSIIYHIAKSIYHRSAFRFYDVLVLIGKNDKEVIKIQIPLQNKEEQKNLESYCMKYLNTDITKLKSIWFIPEKNIYKG